MRQVYHGEKSLYHNCIKCSCRRRSIASCIFKGSRKISSIQNVKVRESTNATLFTCQHPIKVSWGPKAQMGDRSHVDHVLRLFLSFELHGNAGLFLTWGWRSIQYNSKGKPQGHGGPPVVAAPLPQNQAQPDLLRWPIHGGPSTQEALCSLCIPARPQSPMVHFLNDSDRPPSPALTCVAAPSVFELTRLITARGPEP